MIKARAEYTKLDQLLDTAIAWAAGACIVGMIGFGFAAPSIF